jgi:hypothetical protein
LTACRRLEVFKAERPGAPLRVYQLQYAASLETQRYLAEVRGLVSRDVLVGELGGAGRWQLAGGSTVRSSGAWQRCAQQAWVADMMCTLAAFLLQVKREREVLGRHP